MQPAGSRLGPYEIQSSIGAGGMGEVYRARDTRLDRIVALKVIAGAAALDPTFRERFDREARAISALDHPNICTLYDVGHEAGTDFLVMQYLEGETVADRLARGARPKSDPSLAGASAVTSTQSKGPLTVDLALRYGAEIAAALDAAHRRGIVHRDLKPGNIMLTKTGTKLLDFGLAKLAEQGAISGLADLATKTVPLTATGSIVGTLNYMSPEQLEGGTIDARTDIFSFGGRGRGAWGKDGVIVFGSPEGIWSVPASGGVPALVTKTDGDAGETGHLWPVFIEDGRRFLYLARHRTTNRERNILRLSSLDDNTSRDVLEVNSSVELSLDTCCSTARESSSPSRSTAPPVA